MIQINRWSVVVDISHSIFCRVGSPSRVLASCDVQVSIKLLHPEASQGLISEEVLLCKSQVILRIWIRWEFLQVPWIAFVSLF